MTTFYKKVGRKYVEVSQYDNDLQNALPEGSHLFVVKPGQKSIRYDVDPNFVALIAAGTYAKKAMVDALFKASEMKPKQIPLTSEQVIAWDALKKSFNDDLYSVYYDSADKIANAGIDALIEETKKHLENPSVKKAYEQFLLVYKLTQNESS